jgi:GntR family transcriptional regulator
MTCDKHVHTCSLNEKVTTIGGAAMKKRLNNVGSSKAEMVAATIQDEILTGRLPYGVLLESESELVQRFSVSRNTVRKGLEELMNTGLITRKVGVGSFVTYNGQTLDSALGWSKALETADGGAQTRLLQIRVIQDEKLAAELSLEQPAFIAVDRLRVLADSDRPISLELSRIPFSDRLADLPLQGLIGGSLNQTLSEYGMAADHGEEWAEVIGLEQANADILKHPPGTSFLRTRRLTRDKHGNPVEYVVSLLDPAYFGLHLEF